MNLNNTFSVFKKTVLGATVATVVATSAQGDTFTFSVDTNAPVTITERQALLFGKALKLDPLATCEITPLATGDDWDSGEPFAITLAQHTGVAAAGGGCADTSGTTSNYGHYLIAGAVSTPVKITLVSGGADDASFTFAPAGIADNDSAGASAAGEQLITADNQVTVTSDTSGNIGLAVGGEITVGVGGLTAGASIPASFDINVVY